MATSKAQFSSPSAVPPASSAAPLTPQEQVALNTELIGAAMNNDSASLVALLADGANVNLADSNGVTAMHSGAGICGRECAADATSSVRSRISCALTMNACPGAGAKGAP
ncbi:ankyrin repeat domain-containing protein [Arthrobacter glacialis]|uniref:ankyrin repeat domain-containing protein n=1 Tax=Arthrobacter glacialis TaxID=1664 RepID=UPI0010573D6E|nr:ankyrin repeat domain-containing protein [Arthrobacter glacialis]